MDALCSVEEFEKATSRVNATFAGEHQLTLGARISLGIDILAQAIKDIPAIDRSLMLDVIFSQLVGTEPALQGAVLAQVIPIAACLPTCISGPLQ